MADSFFSLAQYRVKPGEQERFKDILRQHNATLRSLELVTDRPTQTFVGFEKGVDGPFFVELMEWVDERAAQLAHSHPQVSAIWEAIGEACEARGGRAMFEFPNLRPLEL